jgi:hypothetical protein
MKTACLYPVLLLSMLLAPSAGAQPLHVLDRGSISLGGFASRISLDGKAEVEGVLDNRGRRLADDFDLGEYRVMKLAEATWSPWERHEFSLRTLLDEYRRDIQLSDEIRFEGQIFPVDVDLRARTRFSTLELGYTWWGYATPQAAVGIQIGVLRIGAGVALSGRIESDDGEVDIDASASRRLYAPVIGIAGRWMLTERVRGYAELRAIQLGYKRIDGTALAGSAGFDWYFSDRWGITVQYADTRVRADYENGPFDGRAELGLRGPQILLKTRW